ncbi:beta-ketoacyl synthase N-terminal-like domain-containing protein [Desulfomarina sp.]
MKRPDEVDRNRIFSDQADESVSDLLGKVPGRWGRMTPLCRLLILETARLLQNRGLLECGHRFSDSGRRVGLIGGTKRGSLYTDLAFIRSMEEGLASPALFGYTLPNIPLAETAVAFGLTGPVFAVFDQKTPLEKAELEANRFLESDRSLELMLACCFDHYHTGNGQEEISVNLTVVEKI